MGSEEEEELDFLTYCSNVEDQDDVFRTFIKLSQFSSPPAPRSELILPLNREEDLITIPDESADQSVPEVDNGDLNRTPDMPDYSHLLNTSETIEQTLSNQSSLAPLSAPSVVEQTVPTSTPPKPAPPLSPKPDFSLLPPPVPERIILPLQPTSDTDTPPPLPPPPPPTSPAITPPKPDRTFLTSPSQVLRKTLEIEAAPTSSPATEVDTTPPTVLATVNTAEQSHHNIPSAEQRPAETTLNTSGTLSRNLSKNMPDKPFSLKDKSLVKSVLTSQEPLFLPRSAQLRKASCHDDVRSPVPRMRAIRSGSCPSSSYSMINLTDLSRSHSNNFKVMFCNRSVLYNNAVYLYY